MGGGEGSLAHYGVMGMKWGIRKDRYKPNGKTKASKINNESEESKKRRLTDKQRKALKVGAVVLGSTLAAYGAYRFYKATDPETSPFYDKASGILRKDPNKSDSKDRDVLEVNKFRAFLGDKGSQNNCAKCSAAFDMRQKGYDVHAGRTTTGVRRTEWDLWYDGNMYRGNTNGEEKAR